MLSIEVRPLPGIARGAGTAGSRAALDHGPRLPGQGAGPQGPQRSGFLCADPGDADPARLAGHPALPPLARRGRRRSRRSTSAFTTAEPFRVVSFGCPGARVPVTAERHALRPRAGAALRPGRQAGRRRALRGAGQPGSDRGAEPGALRARGLRPHLRRLGPPAPHLRQLRARNALPHRPRARRRGLRGASTATAGGSTCAARARPGSSSRSARATCAGAPARGSSSASARAWRRSKGAATSGSTCASTRSIRSTARSGRSPTAR